MKKYINESVKNVHGGMLADDDFDTPNAAMKMDAMSKVYYRVAENRVWPLLRRKSCH